MYKVIVSDLDGTLLNAQHRISDYTEDLIRFVLSKGIPFIIATGRHYRDVVGLTQNLGESLCTITSNGARAHDGFGKLLYQQNMTSVEAKEILTIAAGFNVHQNVYDGDRWLVEQPDLGLLAMHPSGFAYEEVKLLSEPLDNVAKTFFVGDTEVLQQLRLALIARFGVDLNLVFSLDNVLEVMAQGVSKGRALESILAGQNMDNTDSIAFGDGMNDLEMLRWVAQPVLMANAQEALKESLSGYQLAGLNAEDGVARYLKQQMGISSDA